MTPRKRRVHGEIVLTYTIIGFIVLYAIIMALFKIDFQEKEYERAVSDAKANPTYSIELEDESRPELPSMEEMAKREKKPLTKRQQLLEDAGLPIEKDVNWDLVESISCIVEHEVGYNEDYYPGFDFDGLQQLMAKSVINRLRSPLFPDHIVDLVNQEGQYPGMWEYICQNHHNVRDNTQINVLKALYNREDYDFPNDVFFEHSFQLDESLEEATDIGEYTPAVGNVDQAVEWLSHQPISSEIYPFASYIYVESDGAQRLVIFSGSPSGPY